MAQAQRFVISNFLGGLAPSVFVGNPLNQADPGSASNTHTRGWEVFSNGEIGSLQRGYTTAPVTNVSLVQGTMFWMKSYNRSIGTFLFMLGTDDNLILNRLLRLDLSNDTVSNSGGFPHSISTYTNAQQGGTGMEFFGGYLYYASGRYLGRYDMSLTFNDSFNVFLGTQALGDGIDHPMVQGGGKLFIGNSNFSLNTPCIATVDSAGSVNLAALDLSQTEQIIKALEYSRNFLYIATTNNTTQNTNSSDSFLYIWDGISGSWQEQFKFPEENFTALKYVGSQLFCFGNRGFYRFTGSGFELIYPITGGPSAGGVSVHPNGILYFRDQTGLIYAYGTANPQIPPIVYRPYSESSAFIGAIHWASRTKLFASRLTGDNKTLKLYSASGTEAYSTNAAYYVPMIEFGVRTRLVKVYIEFLAWPAGDTMDVKWYTGDGDTPTPTTIGTINTTGELSAEFYPDGCVADHWGVALALTAAPNGVTPKIRRVICEYQVEKE